MHSTRTPASFAQAGAKGGLAALLLLAAGIQASAAQTAEQPAAAPAQAPAPAGQPAGPGTDGQPNWVKLCSQNPQNNQQVCVITRERRAATGQLLAAISIREVADKKILVTAVPPGMLIRPGLQVLIDGAKAQKGAYSICFPNLCFAEVEVNADYIASLKRGNQLVVTTLNQQAKPVNFDISLSGFTAAYDGPAIDPAQIQAEQQQLQNELQRKAEQARQQLIERQQQPQQPPAPQ